MPEIARFYGIIIKMFFKPKEHEPSHVHALYGEYVGTFNKMIEGDLPLKAQNLMASTLLFRAPEDVERSGYHKTPSSCVRL